MRWICNCKIQVFGKTVGLEETLLEASTTLKHPVAGELFVPEYTPQYPSQDVVFFGDLGADTGYFRGAEDLSSIDHIYSPANSVESTAAILLPDAYIVARNQASRYPSSFVHDTTS